MSDEINRAVYAGPGPTAFTSQAVRDEIQADIAQLQPQQFVSAVHDVPDKASLASFLAGLDPIERYEVIADAQTRALQLERNEQQAGSPISIKDAIELEQLMAKAVQTGHCRIVGIEYTPWAGFVRTVRIWDLRDSMWHGVEWRGRLRRSLPSHPWRYDVRADMLAHGWRVIIGTAPDVSAWGIGLQLTSADHALHELGRFGWGVKRLPAFLRAMERTKTRKRGLSWWLKWCVAPMAAGAAVGISLRLWLMLG